MPARSIPVSGPTGFTPGGQFLGIPGQTQPTQDTLPAGYRGGDVVPVSFNGAGFLLPPLIGAGAEALLPGSGAIVGGAAGLLLGDGGNGQGEVSPYMIDGVVMEGPGVLEPHPAQVVKRWETKYQTADGNWYKLVFWLLHKNRVIMWNHRTGGYKTWTIQKPYVMGRKPNVPDLLRMSKVVDNHFAKISSRMRKFQSRVKPKRKRG